MKEFGYGIPMQDGTTIKINAAAYADALILYADTHEHMEMMLALLGQFCSYAKMKVNAEKCVSLSQVWTGAKADKNPTPFYIHTEAVAEEIPMEIVSIYLWMPIGFNKYENTKHWQEVLASMMEDVRNIGRSRLKLVQKMHALKTFVFPRIDYRMMCADLTKTHLDSWDAQFRGIVSEWFKVKHIPVEIFQMSWRDGGFSFPSLRERQNTLVMRTVLDMITSPDEVTRKLVRQFEIAQARNCGTEWKERPMDHNNRGYLNWNPTTDQQNWRAGAPTQ
jgi:hypothetical protein